MLEPPIVIVGGGPAGATAAENLAKKGKNVLLIERSKSYPYREKPCGGGLGPATIKLFPYTKAMGIHTTKKILMSFGDDSIELDIPIVMVNRNEFDLILMKRASVAGAVLRFESTVVTVDYDNKKVLLGNGEIVPFSFLVGAGGVRCPVARHQNSPKATVPLLVGKADGGALNSSETAEIVFFEGFKGYAWVFPKGKFLDVGVGGDATVKELRKRLGAFLKERKLTMYDKTGWTIPFEPPMDPVSCKMLIDSTSAVCGDAAGFANPATGEGIRYAMQSGKEVAEVLLGTRDYKTYPTFLEDLVRLRDYRERFFAKGLKEYFMELKKTPDLARELAGFFFGDRPAPPSAPMTDDERLKALKAIDEKMGV